MSRLSQLRTGAVVGSLIVAGGCAATPSTPKASADAHYALSSIAKINPDSPKIAEAGPLKAVLDSCKGTHQAVYDCLSADPSKLARFGRGFYDGLDDYEQGVVPDPYIGQNVKDLSEYEKAHPEIKFELDFYKEKIVKIVVDFEGETREVVFAPPVDVKFHAYLADWVKDNLHRIVVAYGRDNTSINPFDGTPFTSKAHFNGADLTDFAVEGGHFMTFSPDDGSNWVSYRSDRLGPTLRKIVQGKKDEPELVCPFPACKNDETQVLSDKGVPLLRYIFNDGKQRNETRFVSPVCSVENHYLDEKVGRSKPGLTMKQWTCFLPDGLVVSADVFPKEQPKYAKRLKPRKVVLDAPDEKRDMEVYFTPSGVIGQLVIEEQLRGSGLFFTTIEEVMRYDEYLGRPYYSFKGYSTMGSSSRKIGKKGEILLEDGSSIGSYEEWKKEALAEGRKGRPDEYLDALAKKLRFPLDFYSLAKLHGIHELERLSREDKNAISHTDVTPPHKAVEMNLPPELWTFAFVVQEILKRQGITSQVLDPLVLAHVLDESDMEKIPSDLLFPTVLWVTKRDNGKMDVNHASIVRMGRNGAVFNPESYDGSVKWFFKHPGFKDEEAVLKAAFSALGKSEAEAEELYGSAKAALWKLFGKQIPVKYIDANGKVAAKNVSLDDMVN